ncbi:MAG TPA: flagellar biosynthesis anti-sigma factor FlgM [Fibrobacteria bacterium]|nr:flagellar biosynthesis anti-sigma factor FlgM [Fibrobacteria bacterium]
MKIERIQQVYGADLQKVAGGVKPPEKKEGATKTDSVSLSKKAKELASSSANSSVAAHVKAMPDVRADRVQEAKEKIASGYYSSPKFDEELADRLMKEFGF